MKIYLVFFAFFVGLLVPFQAIINARLSSAVGSTISAALISFAGGFLVFLIAELVSPHHFPRLGELMAIPPYLLTGGIIGSIFVVSAIFIVPKLGSTGWITLIVAGQLVMSLLLDHYGILGLPVKNFNWIRLSGALMLLLGSILIIRF